MKRIPVTANQDKEMARNTRGESQKSEESYRKTIEKAVNSTGQATYSAKKRKP